MSAPKSNSQIIDELRAENAQLSAQIEQLRSCAKFVIWAMNEGPWEGGDLDGSEIQDKAESLGLIVETKFDPEKHKAADWAAPEAGEPWFTLDEAIFSLASTDGDRG